MVFVLHAGDGWEMVLFFLSEVQCPHAVKGVISGGVEGVGSVGGAANEACAFYASPANGWRKLDDLLHGAPVPGVAVRP